MHSAIEAKDGPEHPVTEEIRDLPPGGAGAQAN